MADPRSGLWSEVKRVLAASSAEWFLGENVPGLLSVNGGADWATVLNDLAELGYGYAWRVLDAQFFGVPQRRRRVFLVGRAGGDVRSAAEVLFERDCLPWHSQASREEGAEIAACLSAGVAASRGLNRPGRRREDDVNLVAFGGNNTAGEIQTATACNAQAAESGQVIPFIINAAESCATQRHARETDTVRSLDQTGGFAANQGGTVVAYNPHRTLQPDGGCVEGFKEDTITDALHGPTGNAVRRLLPIECLRLQGLPDDWLDLEPPLSDSAKYRMIGNSVAVPVLEWIGRRMKRIADGK